MIAIFLIAVSLALDAFAVSVTSGLTVKNFNIKHALILGVYFGAFQFIMPLIGWLLGSTVEKYVTAIAPYISFILLAFIGGKMVWGSLSGQDDNNSISELTHGKLFVLAVATSIDAFAVGITFAFDGTNVWLACTIIGIAAFVISMLGGFIGGKLGSKFQKHAELFGGIVLITIGLKTLIEHFV